MAGMWANDLNLVGDTLFITNSGDNSILKYVLTEGTVDTMYVGTGRNPWATAYDPRTDRLFVSNLLTSTVSVFSGTDFVEEIAVGKNPEGMVVVGDLLYVACSAYQDGYRSTLYVLKIDSLNVTDSLRFGTNLQVVVADPEGDVYALATGDYSSVEGWLFRLRDGRLIDSTFIGGNPGAACLSKRGQLFLVGWEGKITVYDWATERITQVDTLNLNLSACGFKGDTLVVADFSNDRILLLQGDEILNTYHVGDGPISLAPDTDL